MPELPEVEVTRRGIEPHLLGARVVAVRLSDKALRWPLAAEAPALLAGQTVLSVDRRGKYLLIETAPGWLIVHLGMSGRLSVLPDGVPPGAWDHADIVIDGAAGRQLLRLTDPRRFGAVVWHARADGPLAGHKLLAALGIEPFSAGFDARLFHRLAQGRRTAIKQVLLAGDIVVGVGNIYASEALFLAGIRPTTAAGKLSLARCEKLVAAIRDVLGRAIAAGGSTLRDFARSDGSPGYFQLETAVYGRAGEPCRVCSEPVRAIRQGQRATFWCSHCQH
ncbi:bifunctional DNA-formamidopyrimidine glycosylase/DNA-(apurinic or apyrimidinic site) lyase [Derxia lacustris]|uniref:bifunctional DNA-formamidopyrimidine glycosylase/DNA-(apurinic or apyrimidinic site) lyase n=1 Tax=Derxia lacustris TaxID=764842 RepID=UPI000A176038|nr:bifunctional DNA-formamidopyrimidine glycosylase/DNA-(apurinic or apyrimidinic site) lyase [Derxia lacustris]